MSDFHFLRHLEVTSPYSIMLHEGFYNVKRARDTDQKQKPKLKTQFVYKVGVKLSKSQAKLKIFRKDKQEKHRWNFHKGSFRLRLATSPFMFSMKHTNVKVVDLQ